MSSTIRKAVAGIAALGALALGGAAIANAASDDSAAATQATANQTAAGNGTPHQGGGPGGHVGAGGEREELLTGATADKVEKAALAEVSGGTILRVETDVDHGSAYEAHVRKSDGTEVEVLVNKDFEVTAVNDRQR